MSHTAVLVLAAGHSRRFRLASGQHKLLALLDNRPVLQHTLEQASATGLDVCVVTRPEDRAIHALLADATPVFCASEGIGESIAAGVRACASYDSWLIVLGDMPWLTTASYLAVHHALQQAAVVRAVVDNTPGHPVGFGRQFYRALSELRDDVGAQSLLIAHPPLRVCLNDRGCLLDIDRPADLLAREPF